jgi:hypothetical protein
MLCEPNTEAGEVLRLCVNSIHGAYHHETLHTAFWLHMNAGKDYIALSPIDYPVKAVPQFARYLATAVVEVLFSDAEVRYLVCENVDIARNVFRACQMLKQTEGWVSAAVRYSETGEVYDAVG